MPSHNNNNNNNRNILQLCAPETLFCKSEQAKQKTTGLFSFLVSLSALLIKIQTRVSCGELEISKSAYSVNDLSIFENK